MFLLLKKEKLKPAISIIIPMYNSEKYIIQCLNSILNQTFQDFEIIVVDDCSTDRSFSIVKNFSKNFDNKLKLVKNNKNFGGSAVPRNIGLGVSRGKYILFIDNDDMILSDALEKLYDVAEKTQADVIHAEKWLEPQNETENITRDKKFIINTFEEGGFVDDVIVETEDLSERLKMYCKKHFFWHVWNKFFRRDFLIENNILFPEILTGEDTMFCFFCLCFAKTYVRVPFVFNIWRVRGDSVSHRMDSIKNYIHKYVTFFMECTKILNDFMNEQDFFKKHSEYKYLVMDFFMRDHWHYLDKMYVNFPPIQVDMIIREEVLKSSTDNSVLTSFLFGCASIYRLQFMQTQKQILLLKRELQEKNDL